MNERLKELLEQAVMAVDNPFPSNPLNAELKKMYIPDCFAEKFAELLIRECLTVINQPNGVGDDDVIRISQDVKKHFGVENA